MPEYLAPGVFVEETSFRQKTIEGVGTSTAAFIGPTRFGPLKGEPELLTSFGDFERIYGGIDQIDYGGTDRHNYVAHAVRAFFENGGKRAYVTRTYLPAAEEGDEEGEGEEPEPTPASVRIGTNSANVLFSARHPGKAGNFQMTLAFEIGPNIFDEVAGRGVLRGGREYDTVWIDDDGSGASSLFWLEDAFDSTNGVWTYALRRSDQDSDDPPRLVTEESGVEVRRLTVNVTVGRLGEFMDEQSWTGLTFHPERSDALTQVFAAEPARRSTELHVPLVAVTNGLDDGADIAERLLAERVPPRDLLEGMSATTTLRSTLEDLADETGIEFPRRIETRLEEGDDGTLPTSAEYEGDVDSTGVKSGFKALEDLSDVSIVAAPGSTAGYAGADSVDRSDIETIQSMLIGHCERMRYRIAVLDSPDKAIVSDALAYRGKFDSKHAALYYPWVTIFDPVTRSEVDMPPSGFVAGIYARNDVERGVHKAPANEAVRLAVDFEVPINTAQQEVLNPAGVNCFRFLESRGYRLWGARTITSDPEWKYVNLRRYFAFLEASIDKGTQWAVFEPNGERLWANVRRTVEDFLYNEFVSGHLLGATMDEAFFVRCDRSTMTQNDLDNGRLVCLIGVAPLRPAEFVIFRIGQKTLEATA